MKCDSEKVMSFIDNDFASCEGINLPQMKRKNVSFTKALNLIITRVLDNTKEELTHFRMDGSNTSVVWSKNILSFITIYILPYIYQYDRFMRINYNRFKWGMES